MYNGFAAGDLVSIPNLPRNNGSMVWHPDPAGPFMGLVVEVKKPRTGKYSLVGECVVIKLDNGELITLSANMVELIKRPEPRMLPCR